MASILIGELDPGCADLLRDHLTGDGHHVTVAHTDHSLIDLAARQHTDLVVLDWSLQILAGGTLCAGLRTQGDGCVPVVALTRGIMQRTEAEEQPCVRAVIAKRADLSELSHQVAVVLNAPCRLGERTAHRSGPADGGHSCPLTAKSSSAPTLEPVMGRSSAVRR